MADLYTTLVRAKQELNGGVLPAMTPIPENAQNIIDPAFTPGLGALEEHPEKGLRCPVRGCGKWTHRLGDHLGKKHGDIGGARAVKYALSIPMGAPLASSRYRDGCRSRTRRLIDTGVTRPPMRTPAWNDPVARAANARRAGRNGTGTVGFRNLRNSCAAQLIQRLLAVRDRIGRTPSAREATQHDGTLVKLAQNLYGSWNGLVAAAGLVGRPTGNRDRAADRAHVLVMLREWCAVHGSLPTRRQVATPTSAPLLPSYKAVLRAFECESYPEAMRRAAALLNIYGGRYGLPENMRPLQIDRAHGKAAEEALAKVIASGKVAEQAAAELRTNTMTGFGLKAVQA